jgi:hypothetical protein
LFLVATWLVMEWFSLSILRQSKPLCCQSCGNWCAPKLLDRFKYEFEVKTRKEQGIGDTVFGSQHFGGRGACWSSGMGLGRLISTQSFTRTYTKPNNKLVSA